MAGRGAYLPGFLLLALSSLLVTFCGVPVPDTLLWAVALLRAEAAVVSLRPAGDVVLLVVLSLDCCSPRTCSRRALWAWGLPPDLLL